MVTTPGGGRRSGSINKPVRPAARHILDVPGLFNWDFGLYMNFPVSDRCHLRFRSEFYNPPNHAHFGHPSMLMGSATIGQI
jgi:hypothetical protein